jgi:type IV pilus assembly protein PilV
MRRIHSRSRRQPIVARRRLRGAVLIEVLVSLLIFMFGVLGLVGLQASVTRSQTDSKVRADAGYLASEMVGRLWADLTHLTSYSGTACASTALCKEWQDKVAASLPRGTGAVTVDSSTGDVTVTITWTGPDGQAHHYVTNTTVAKSGA